MSLDSGLVPLLQTSVHRCSDYPASRCLVSSSASLQAPDFRSPLPAHPLSLPRRGNRKFSGLLPHSENIACGPIAPEPSVREMPLFSCFFEVITSESSSLFSSFRSDSSQLFSLTMVPLSRSGEFSVVFDAKRERRVTETRPGTIMPGGLEKSSERPEESGYGDEGFRREADMKARA